MEYRPMRLFKQQYRDRAGAIQRTANWYAEFRYDDRVRRVPLFTDKGASTDAGRQIQRLMACRGAGESPDTALTKWLETMPPRLRTRLVAMGLVDARRVASARPLLEHVSDFKAALLAKGATARHAELVSSRARKVVEGCKYLFWSQIRASGVQAYVAALRDGTREARGVSAQTANFYLAAVKQFCRWAVRDGRASESPVAFLEGWNVKTDRRHDRRALTLDEVRWLLRAAEGGPEVIGMTGPERSMLYRLALESGLRAGELRSLTRSSFRLEGAEPTVTVAAGYSKRRREDVQPLKPATAAALRTFLGSKAPAAKAFSVPPRERVAELMRADLAAARAAWLGESSRAEERAEWEVSDFLRYRDGAGRVADFHALRHTFISNLASAGVHPKTAQMLARHSTITLTMDRYSHTLRGAETTALAALPDLSIGDSRLRATGTDGDDKPPPPAGPSRRESGRCWADSGGKSPDFHGLKMAGPGATEPAATRGENAKTAEQNAIVSTPGGVTEWPNVPVLKTGIPARVSGVRISPPPLPRVP
jgi:integrase